MSPNSSVDPGPPPPGQEFFPLEWNKAYGQREVDAGGQRDQNSLLKQEVKMLEPTPTSLWAEAPMEVREGKRPA